MGMDQRALFPALISLPAIAINLQTFYLLALVK